MRMLPFYKPCHALYRNCSKFLKKRSKLKRMTFISVLLFSLVLMTGCGGTAIVDSIDAIKRYSMKSDLNKECQKTYGRKCFSFKGIGSITSLDNHLYVSDYNQKIYKIDVENGRVKWLSGSGRGWQDGPPLSARFDSISGMTAYGGFLFVCERRNNRIRKVDTESGEVSTVAGDGDEGWQDGPGLKSKFRKPSDITTDGVFLYIADNFNHRIRKVHIMTNEVATLAGSGIKGHRDGKGREARFSHPFELVRAGGTLFVLDITGVRKVNPMTGDVTTLAKQSVESLLNNTVKKAERDYHIRKIATDEKYLYFAVNNVIKSMNIDTGEVKFLAGQSKLREWKNGVGGEASFVGISAISIEKNLLYIADSHYPYGFIRKLDIKTGKVDTLWSKDKTILQGQSYE